MELDEFVSITVKSLIKGINDSKGFAEENGAIINPILIDNNYDSSTSIWRKDGKDGRRYLTNIEFDIAVTASNEDATNAGGGLRIQVLNLGLSTANKESNQTISRIKFSLNVALPHQGDE